MDPRRNQAAIIIHASATGAAALSGVMANIAMFGADIPFLAAINITMILSLGKLFGQKLERKALTTVGLQLLAMSAGPLVAKGLLGIVPGLGNLINAGVAFTITEGIGWTAFMIFDSGNDITKMKKPDLEGIYKKRNTIEKPDINKLRNAMSPEDRARYEYLQSQVNNKSISDEERQGYLDELGRIAKKYSE
ncbi:MAG: hypothetical protein AB4911_22990 [Oscillochloridaceae bacterium umkhey_bin13]